MHLVLFRGHTRFGIGNDPAAEMNPGTVQCVLLADRHHGITEGIRGLLETTFDAVVMVADETSLIESAARLRPTLAVVDLSLARGNSLHWLRRLRASSPGSKIIVVSVHDEPGVARAALESGADAFVLKRDLATDLLPSVDALLAAQPRPAAEGGNSTPQVHPARPHS